MKLKHETQQCPNCGKTITPIQTGGIFPQNHGMFIAYATNVKCPECGGKWLTQVDI